MAYFLIGLAALALVLYAMRGIARANPVDLARTLRKIAGGALLALAFLLTVTGRFAAAAPLGALGLSLLWRSGGFGFPFPMGRTDKTPGRTSSVRTDRVEMILDHDSGEMAGRVLEGRFAGRMLSDLSLGELIALRGECLAEDPKAAQLIEAYLDRTQPDWREAMAGGDAPSGESGGPMTREEAYRILGLEPGASPEAIHRAHRQLMKKVHPDQGGSTYLAAKINQAKDVLLGGD